MNKDKISLEKQRLKALFGENKELKENPDKEHAVKCHNGVFIPKIDDTVRIFKGIPFALPPVGEKR